MQYWLVKQEPEKYAWTQFVVDKGTYWDGVRNYQARNTLRDEMKLGDRVLVYHSNADPPGVAGVAVVTQEGYPDFTSWDPEDKHYDPKSSQADPRWFMVDIRLEFVFDALIGLPELRKCTALTDMLLLRKGSRLSVQSVRKKEFDAILKIAAKR